MRRLIVSSASSLVLVMATGFALAQAPSNPNSTTAPPAAGTPSGSGAAQQAPAPGDTKSGTKSGPTAQDRAAPTAQDKAGTSTPSAAKDAKSTSPAPDTKSGAADAKSGPGSSTAGAAPPAEKRTQITSAFKQEKVTEVTNVNFNVSIGTAIPATIHVNPLPSRIVEIYPEWRGYDFIFVRGRYVILRPKTREIVYIIEG